MFLSSRRGDGLTMAPSEHCR